MSVSVLPMFSFMSFMVSCLKFRPFNHLELIFIYGVRECSNFIDLHVAVQLSHHHLLKRLSFLHCIVLPPLSQINLTLGVWVYFWNFYSVPLIYIRLIYFLNVFSSPTFSSAQVWLLMCVYMCICDFTHMCSFKYTYAILCIIYIKLYIIFFNFY